MFLQEYRGQSLKTIISGRRGEKEVNVHHETKLPCTVIMGEIMGMQGERERGGNAILCSSTSSSTSASSYATLAWFGLMTEKCCCSSEFLTPTRNQISTSSVTVKAEDGKWMARSFCDALFLSFVNQSEQACQCFCNIINNHYCQRMKSGW